MMKLAQHTSMVNSSGPRGGKPVVKRHLVMDEVIDRMKLDIQPGRSAGGLVIVN